jgi:rubrerythrin
MGQSSSAAASTNTGTNESTKLSNSTFNIISVLDKEATFLYHAADRYIEDARRENRNDLVNTWNTIKQDKERHVEMLREALSKGAKEEGIH